MVRSLWTAATGMIAQQNNVDTIANNLANVNTVGYKTQVAEFKSLLYQNVQTKTTSANGEAKPVGAQIGMGVRNSSVNAIFTPGSFLATGNNSSFAISGDGFFGVKGADGNNYYTKNGNFNISLGTNGLALTTTEGFPVLDSTGKAIVFPKDLTSNKISMTADGEFCYPDEKGNAKPLGIKIGMYQFANPAGLEKHDNSLFSATAASGAALNEATNANLTKSGIAQGYLEGSNVQVVDEMVNMIVAQRAYEMNSKAIQASDEMLQQANQLRR